MIRINLLGEKVDNSGMYLLHMLLFSVVTIIVIVSLCILHGNDLKTIGRLEGDKNMLTLRISTLKRQTKDVENIESNKKELKIMLQTISQLKSQRRGPVHVLSELNSAVPDKSWLVKIEGKSGTIDVSGYALDNQTVARFITSIEASPFFMRNQVKLSQTRLEAVDLRGKQVKLTAFSLSANIVNLLEMRSGIKKQM